MLRESLLPVVFESRLACADQTMAGMMAPVGRSILWATISPSHTPVRKVELKMKLLVCVMFGLDVAEAAAAAVATLRFARAVCSPRASEFGSPALKYLPRPFTAACQRSSRVLGSFPEGDGQSHTPVVHEQPVAPALILAKSPVSDDS